MRKVPVDCRKDRGLRAAWRLTLPANLLPCWEPALLNHRIARLAANRWISRLHRWLISWMPGSLSWPQCLLLPGVTKIRLLLPASSLWQVSLLLPAASCFPLPLPGLSLHMRQIWAKYWAIGKFGNCHQMIEKVRRAPGHLAQPLAQTPCTSLPPPPLDLLTPKFVFAR